MLWQTKGFTQIKQFFEQVKKDGQLSHAYIFSGQEMIGKRTFALELAEFLNDQQPDLTGDFLLVNSDCSESGESISIEKMREVKNFLSLSSVGRYKFVIIDNAEQMTHEAQNSFLKILEETNQSSIILLVTVFPEELLETIVSRCQLLTFPNHSQIEVSDAILSEGVEEKKAVFVSQLVNGRLGLAFKITRDNLYTDVKKYLSELSGLKSMTLVDRLKLAHKLSGEEDLTELKQKLLIWMLYLKSQSTLNHPIMLNNIAKLNFYLSQPQYNRRLMFEEFMVKL